MDNVDEQTRNKMKQLFRKKDALNSVLEAMAYASEGVYFLLLDACKQIVKEMYEIFYSCEFWDDTPDYMSKDHPMERIQKLYFQDDEDLDWKDYLYITGNEVENPDDCELCRQTCLKYNEIRNYIGMGDKTFFTLHISDLKIYDKQKELKEFYLSNFKGKCEYQERGYNLDFCTAFENGMRFCKQLHCDKKRVKTAPQSWLYVEG